MSRTDVSPIEAQLSDPGTLAAISETFENASASAVVAWTVEHFGDDVVLASSFEDAVLIDLAVSVKPDIEVMFLDTQYHFAETLWFVEELRARYNLNLRVMKPLVAPDNRWQRDVGDCCQVRKVEPLERGLAGRRAWLTGLKRVDAPTRRSTPIIAWDAAHSMVKVNPLATWTAEDMAGYASDHDLPVNPLTERGYPSIGCWPCTKPVAPGADPRSGRWAGSEKVECGLHVAPSAPSPGGGGAR